jgi:hypothetical protein
LACLLFSNGADYRTVTGTAAARTRGTHLGEVALDVLAPALAACLAGRGRSAASSGDGGGRESGGGSGRGSSGGSGDGCAGGVLILMAGAVSTWILWRKCFRESQVHDFDASVRILS